MVFVNMSRKTALVFKAFRAAVVGTHEHHVYVHQTPVVGVAIRGGFKSPESPDGGIPTCPTEVYHRAFHVDSPSVD